MKVQPKQKFKTASYGTVTVREVSPRGRGHTVTFAVRGEPNQSVSMAKFREITGNADLYA